MSRASPSPADAKAKAAVPTLSRGPGRCPVICRVRRPMDRCAVMVGVVPALDESRRRALVRRVTLGGAGRLTCDDR
jgi:hypothetical protein